MTNGNKGTSAKFLAKIFTFGPANSIAFGHLAPEGWPTMNFIDQLKQAGPEAPREAISFSSQLSLNATLTPL